MMVSAAATPAPSASSNGATNGVHPLLRAVIYEDAAEVKKLLLQDGVNVDVRDRYGYTPLHKACMRGNKELVSLLLDKGADIQAICYEGSTPLFLATMCSPFSDVIETLLSRGAKTNVLTKDGGTMLHAAASGGNMNTVKLFLEEKKMDIHARRYEGATVLLDAVQHSGNKTLIEYLISKGADINAVDNQGANVMHKATEAVKFLLEEKHVKDINQAKAGGETIVHQAARSGQVDFLEFLVGVDIGANVRATREDGATALHVACEIPSAAEMAKYLVKKGLDVNAKRKDGATCLHAAAFVGNVDLVAFLLTRGGDAAIAMESGATPVHCAAGGGHNKVLELFVEKGFIDEGEVQKMLAEAAE